jgi:hypothetical protein
MEVSDASPFKSLTEATAALKVEGSLSFNVRKLVDLTTPSIVIAGLSGRYPSIAIGNETMSKVESLAKPASILTDFVSIGIVPNQSANSSGDNWVGLISSLIRMLKRSLGYSGNSGIEIADEAPLLLKGLMLPPGGSELSEEDPG